MDSNGGMETLIKPVSAAGPAEEIVRSIGELIGAGLLQAGDRLPSEQELSGRFGVSAMTLRQALAALRQEGLIETRRGRGGGSFISSDISRRLAEISSRHTFTLDQVAELTTWRCAISGEASARTATRATDVELTRLVELADRTHALFDDPAAYRVADARFHLAIAEISGSMRLLKAERSIQDEMTQLLAGKPDAPASRSSEQQLHTPLMNAIASRDAIAAREAFHRHAQATYDLVSGLMYFGRRSAG